MCLLFARLVESALFCIRLAYPVSLRPASNNRLVDENSREEYVYILKLLLLISETLTVESRRRKKGFAYFDVDSWLKLIA